MKPIIINNHKTHHKHITVTIDKDILCYAFRYSLTRLSYAPELVIENLKNNFDVFEEWEIKQMQKEIEDAQKFADILSCWNEFDNFLVKELEKRNK